MGFTDAVKTCLSKYATFSGRASRSEYWWFYLAFIIAAIICTIPLIWLANNMRVPGAFYGDVRSLYLPYYIPIAILVLATFVPFLAVSVRRLHDSNKRGWWYLVTLVPYVGGLIYLVLMVLPGTKGANRFGPDPLGETNVEGVF